MRREEIQDPGKKRRCTLPPGEVDNFDLGKKILYLLRQIMSQIAFS
jgi:hypothetical protein